MSGSNLRPFDKVVFSKTPDDEGGYTIEEVAVATVYLCTRVHEGTISAVCRQDSPLTVKDIVRLDDGLYEVMRKVRQPGGQYAELSLERLSKPIEPVQEGTS